MTAIEHFLKGLRDRFGAGLIDLPDGTVQAVVRGRQKVTIAFDESARTATIVTPVAAASRELPATILNDLLQRNFPDSRMAGSLLAAIPAEEVLVAINVVPLYSATPELVAGIAMAQAHAALEMSSSILASRSESGQEADDDDDAFEDDEPMNDDDDDEENIVLSSLMSQRPDRGVTDDDEEYERERRKV
ncbi:MAG: type III secretion system chaperone [Aestuariivirgaceae bacterium]|jgi:hypothetical protein